MATELKGSRTALLIGALTLPIELALVVPVRWYLTDMGVHRLDYEHDFLGLRTLYLTLGIFGAVALIILLLGFIYARTQGQIPYRKGLTTLYAITIAIALLQSLLLFRA